MRANTSWIVAVAITVAAVAAGCTSTRARIGPQPFERGAEDPRVGLAHADLLKRRAHYRDVVLIPRALARQPGSGQTALNRHNIVERLA